MATRKPVVRRAWQGLACTSRARLAGWLLQACARLGLDADTTPPHWTSSGAPVCIGIARVCGGVCWRNHLTDLSQAAEYQRELLCFPLDCFTLKVEEVLRLCSRPQR